MQGLINWIKGMLKNCPNFMQGYQKISYLAEFDQLQLQKRNQQGWSVLQKGMIQILKD